MWLRCCRQRRGASCPRGTCTDAGSCVTEKRATCSRAGAVKGVRLCVPQAPAATWGLASLKREQHVAALLLSKRGVSCPTGTCRDAGSCLTATREQPGLTMTPACTVLMCSMYKGESAPHLRTQEARLVWSAHSWDVRGSADLQGAEDMPVACYQRRCSVEAHVGCLRHHCCGACPAGGMGSESTGEDDPLQSRCLTTSVCCSKACALGICIPAAIICSLLKDTTGSACQQEELWQAGMCCLKW